MKFRNIVPTVLALACGCASTITVPITPPGDKVVTMSGPLTLTVSDFATNAGVLWVQPGAVGSAGAVTAMAIRYGSLCATAVTGRADIVATRVFLHITYAVRTGAVCTTEIRALRYDAVIGGLAPSRFEVHLLHSNGDANGEAEVRVQTVDVS